mgnify:CR=1 FL=1|jgi:hypothetical protein|tara:strand:- start:713 stop:1003 length:291 start_codon:yes stop_codon:yes gene_type:complete
MINQKRIPYPRNGVDQARDNFNLAKLLSGDSVGSTPVGLDKWALSIERLMGLDWTIYEFNRSEKSTFFKLDEVDIKQAGVQGQEFAFKHYLSKLKK